MEEADRWRALLAGGDHCEAQAGLCAGLKGPVGARYGAVDRRHGRHPLQMTIGVRRAEDRSGQADDPKGGVANDTDRTPSGVVIRNGFERRERSVVAAQLLIDGDIANGVKLPVELG